MMGVMTVLDRAVGDLVVPDRWGEGLLFGFSGVDGPTDVLSSFVATATARPFGLLFQHWTRRLLEIEVPDGGQVRIATGDVMGAEWADGTALLVAFATCHSIVGLVPSGADVTLRFESGRPTAQSGNAVVAEDSRWGDALALCSVDSQFALGYGRTVDEATALAERALQEDPVEVARQRLRFLRRGPASPDKRHARLLAKCLSVMKVNTLGPEGQVARRWSTPDRVPHRDMWLWDSVFHSFAMNHVDPDLAWDFLAAVLESQRDDGMVPERAGPYGEPDPMTQPPLLAWAVATNYRRGRDRDRLAWAFPRLERASEWNLEHRDDNHNGLLEWLIEDDEQCRSGESGMDNSPRFDDALTLDAVDFSAYAALDMAHLAGIAAELGEWSRAERWTDASRQMSGAIDRLLWDGRRSFYYDRNLTGDLSAVTAVSGLLPLLLSDLSPTRVDRLIEALDDPALFKSKVPVPSVAVSAPYWSTDMWRGAAWVNTNFLIICGLHQHGRERAAQRLRAQTIEMVSTYYERYGVLFEFFDSSDERPPTECDRKGPRSGPYDVRGKYDAIRDLHWTAALTACLILDELPDLAPLGS